MPPRRGRPIIDTPSTDIWDLTRAPRLDHAVAVVTGANSGIGLETARGLARSGAEVVLACRNIDHGTDARAKILDSVPDAKLRVSELDLADLDSIRRCARRLAATYRHIDLLINNAGVMHQRRTMTRDGFEGDFGVNFLGQFALTGLLLDRLTTAPAGRIVLVSSKTHRRARLDFDNLELEHSFTRDRAYARSKLAQLTWMYALQRRLDAAAAPAICLAAHPGGTRTAILREQGPRSWVFDHRLARLTNWFTQGPVEGALPILRAATDVNARATDFYGPGGRFEQIGPAIRTAVSDRARDTDAQERLWRVAEELTGVTYGSA